MYNVSITRGCITSESKAIVFFNELLISLFNKEINFIPSLMSCSVYIVICRAISSLIPRVHVIPSLDCNSIFSALIRQRRPSWNKRTATSPLVRPGKFGCCCSPANSSSAQTYSLRSRISLRINVSWMNCSGSFCFSCWPLSWMPLVEAFLTSSLWTGFFAYNLEHNISQGVFLSHNKLHESKTPLSLPLPKPLLTRWQGYLSKRSTNYEYDSSYCILH